MGAEAILKMQGELIMKEMCGKGVRERSARAWFARWCRCLDNGVAGTKTIDETCKGFQDLAEVAEAMAFLAVMTGSDS